MSRRPAAILALLAVIVGLGCAVYSFVSDFPRGLVVFALLLLGLGAAWMGLLRKGSRRWLGFAVAALLLVASVVVTAGGGNGWLLAVSILAFAGSLAAARQAFRPERDLPRVTKAPVHPVLFVNPRSGDGRAEEVGLVAAARERGLEVVELEQGEDLAELVDAAVEGGADALAMAGGDGSQALVASIAADRGLPYACIPSGTRNHFALDLGVDREDVVGALAALADGAGERYVDLGEVNGRVFVNNVSLGVYAEAVSQDSYREAKLRTLLDTLAETLGPEGEPQELRWTDSDGLPQMSTALVLVSNNPYRLGPTLGSGTRPRLDTGSLGVVDFAPPASHEGTTARWREISVPDLTVESDRPIPLGVDGESLTMDSPLEFRVRPRALHVLIAPDHPGASPSAEAPRGPVSALKELTRRAFAP
jgi:diacylglycerol kinase family enzyme